MKRKWLAMLVTLLLLALCAAPALADSFILTTKSVTLFEDETWQAELTREGDPAQGEVTWASNNTKVATVSEDGLVTAVKKGQITLTASVKTDKRTYRTQMEVKVLRRVTKVTLSTQRLTVYASSDPMIFDLLQEGTEYPVIVLSAGKAVTLTTTCTPEDASNRNVTYTTSDAGVAKVSGRELRAIQAGECDLTIASVQNPEITETYHILVTQPITKLEITADAKSVPVGETVALNVNYTPANATIKQVTWSSRNTKVATVDENGVVTGVNKGNVTIDAKAADGSGRQTSFTIAVTRTATSLTLKDTAVSVVTGRTINLTAQIQPTDTNDKTVTWTSSDESIATVKNGQVKGIQAGVCDIIATSNSNPNLQAVATVQVIQRAKKIEFGTASGSSISVGETLDIIWSVLPEDATIKEVNFTSSQPKIASVDANGTVTGLARGSTTITASATDGSGVKASLRINVTQPVEGVSIQYGVYHVQIHRSLGIKALLEPSNASNTAMTWYSSDDSIVGMSGTKNVGTAHGVSEGTVTVTGVTEDGGYSATAEVRVADFNGAVMIEEVRVVDNKIRLVFRNMSDFVINRVYFRIDCYDVEGNPMVCNTDGESTFFTGTYPLALYPRERTEHGQFKFQNYAYEQQLGTVMVHITGWQDSEGYTRNIGEDDQPLQYWTYTLPISNG